MVLVELSKQTRAPVGPGVKIHVPSPLELLDGAVRPARGRAPLARKEPRPEPMTQRR